MPTRRTALTAILCCSLAAAGCAAPSQPSGGAGGRADDAPPAGRLDDAIGRAMRTARIPGAMVGIWSPGGDYVRAFGVADTSTGTPMRTDFYSRIGSVTKTFTATAVLQLVDRGKVGLDDPISRYVDGVPAGNSITVRQLATMRSGLADYSETESFARAAAADPTRDFTARELLDWSFAEPPNFRPGAKWQYCNTNYILLGLLIENAAATTLADYLAEHLFGPLGLKHSSFPTGPRFPEPHARGYTDPIDGDGPALDGTDFSASMTGAAGAIISTLDDMRVWVPSVAQGTLISPAMQRERLSTASGSDLPPGTSYGIGLLSTAGWVGHNGSVPGYQTVAVFLPERSITLVVFATTDIAVPGVGTPSTALAKAVTSVLTPDDVYGV